MDERHKDEYHCANGLISDIGRRLFETEITVSDDTARSVKSSSIES